MSAVINSLLSGIVASIIVLVWTLLSEKKRKKYEYKLTVFKDLMAYRNDITGNASTSGVFEAAINQVFVAYNDCSDVLDNFEKFRKAVCYEKNSDAVINELLQLLKSMAKELKINYTFSNDDLFCKPIKIGTK